MVTIGFIIVHIYYKHVMKIVDHQRFRTLNYIARCAGFTSAYGLIIVGSFQVTKISTSSYIKFICCCRTKWNGLHSIILGQYWHLVWAHSTVALSR